MRTAGPKALAALAFGVAFGFPLGSCSKSSEVWTRTIPRPVACYPFDGTADDPCGHKDGQIVGNVTATTDRFGNVGGALLFDGSTGMVAVDPSLGLMDLGWPEYTVSGWFNVADVTRSNQEIFNSTPHRGLGVSLNHVDHSPPLGIAWYVGAGLASDPPWDFEQRGIRSDFQPNRWYFFAAVKDGNQYSFYVDGELDLQAEVPEAASYSATVGCSMGSIVFAGGLYEFFQGALDDFRIYDSALTGSEILDLYRYSGAQPYVISGAISGAVSQGVTVSLSGGSTASIVTGEAGHYAFAGLDDGEYSVTPSLNGYTFEPSSRSVSLSGADVGGQDFTAVRISGPYTIGGTVVGLTSSGLVLSTPGQPDLPVAPGQATFAFAYTVPSGTSYQVMVTAQPDDPAQSCYVVGGTGLVGAGDVADIFVACSTDAYTSFLDGPRAVVQLQDMYGWYCTGTAFVGNRVATAPVYVLAAGHCTGITFEDEVFADVANGAGIRAYFNGFADAPAGEQFSVSVAGIVYSTMWGHDLSLLELGADQASLASRGVVLPALAAQPPPAGGVFTYGYRVDDPRMRRVDCVLGPREWVHESVWNWMSAFRGECPVTYIRPGASGSPVFAQSTDEIFGVLNTRSEDIPAPTCDLGYPCEMLPTGAENVPLRAYFQDATRLKGCFTEGGVFDRALAGCGLPGSTFSLQPVAGQPDQLAVVENTTGVAVGAYRYKVSPLATFDPADASGYGPPTTSASFTFTPAGERFVVSAVSETDFHLEGIDPLALHVAVFWQ